MEAMMKHDYMISKAYHRALNEYHQRLQLYVNDIHNGQHRPAPIPPPPLYIQEGPDPNHLITNPKAMEFLGMK